MYTRIVQIHINIPATTQKHYSYIHIHILITITRFKKKMLLISLYVSKVMVLLIRSFTIAFLGIAHLTFWFRLCFLGFFRSFRMCKIFDLDIVLSCDAVYWAQWEWPLMWRMRKAISEMIWTSLLDRGNVLEIVWMVAILSIPESQTSSHVDLTNTSKFLCFLKPSVKLELGWL